MKQKLCGPRCLWDIHIPVLFISVYTLDRHPRTHREFSTHTPLEILWPHKQKRRGIYLPLKAQDNVEIKWKKKRSKEKWIQGTLPTEVIMYKLYILPWALISGHKPSVKFPVLTAKNVLYGVDTRYPVKKTLSFNQSFNQIIPSLTAFVAPLLSPSPARGRSF